MAETSENGGNKWKWRKQVETAEMGEMVEMAEMTEHNPPPPSPAAYQLYFQTL